MIAAPMSLIQAQELDPSTWDTLSPSDLDLDADSAADLARVWLWVCGVDPEGADADRVRREVLSDGGLLVALSLPAAELLDWFRGADWSGFDSSERTGGTVWAWVALNRLKGACDTLAALAGQVSLGSVALG